MAAIQEQTQLRQVQMALYGQVAVIVLFLNNYMVLRMETICGLLLVRVETALRRVPMVLTGPDMVYLYLI